MDDSEEDTKSLHLEMRSPLLRKREARSASKLPTPPHSRSPGDIDLENIKFASTLTSRRFDDIPNILQRQHPSDIIKSDNVEQLKEIFNTSELKLVHDSFANHIMLDHIYVTFVKAIINVRNRNNWFSGCVFFR
jgi:hypothetical protein